jgi:hypothetical protein
VEGTCGIQQNSGCWQMVPTTQGWRDEGTSGVGMGEDLSSCVKEVKSQISNLCVVN